MLPPASSSDSAALDVPRFHLKLRKGLFERERGLPIFNEPPDGDIGDTGIERLESELPAEWCFDFMYFFLLLLRLDAHTQIKMNKNE